MASEDDIARIRKKMEVYQPAESVRTLLTQTPIVLLVGISGAGKDTLKHLLLERYPEKYHHIVSHTTRAPRENHGVMEQDNIDYHFIDFVTAEKLLDNSDYVEAKMYSGNIYGTSVAEIQKAHDEGRIAITDLEVQGVQEYVELTPSVKPIFILPPNFATWQQRLKQRYEDGWERHQDDIAKRLQTARQELEFVKQAGYFYLVVNDDLERALRQVDSIARSPETTPRNDLRTLTVLDELLTELQKVAV
ncbi:MAG: guanylate kinase [Candidatus Saccharimonadales bacterium]